MVPDENPRAMLDRTYLCKHLKNPAGRIIKYSGLVQCLLLFALLKFVGLRLKLGWNHVIRIESMAEASPKQKSLFGGFSLIGLPACCSARITHRKEEYSTPWEWRDEQDAIMGNKLMHWWRFELAVFLFVSCCSSVLLLCRKLARAACTFGKFCMPLLLPCIPPVPYRNEQSLARFARILYGKPVRYTVLYKILPRVPHSVQPRVPDVLPNAEDGSFLARKSGRSMNSGP